MNLVVYHIVSGHSFLTGVVLLIIASLGSTRPRPLPKRVTMLAVFIGVLGIVLSSTAIPYVVYAAAGVATIGWLMSLASERLKKRWHPTAAYLMAAGWVAAGLFELPYQMTPSPHAASSRSMTVVGDSVTAGVGGDETSETWPSILEREHHLIVQDISHIGETAASALKRVKSGSVSSPIVVLEIGGNDVLGATSSDQFAHDLDQLLAHLVADGRQLIMFELPLPPFFHEYNRVQRQLAAKYEVHLVPKRVFLSVIAGDDSTLDSVHLSQAGHQKMADCVWQPVRPAFELNSIGSEESGR